MINRLPHWFKQEIPEAAALERMRLISGMKINTVCKEAKCPNFSRCLRDAQLTFLILGNICTRNCSFCNVEKIAAPRQLAIDEEEPYRIKHLVEILKLKFVVITSVTRDDLDDGGAAQFAKTIELIRSIDKDIKVEALISDFSGKIGSLKTVINARPSVLAHNIETVPRLYKEIRPKADYSRSLAILREARFLNPLLITKSSVILGMGEEEEEVLQAMKDLRDCRCDILTLGQYLAPSKEHYSVKEFIDIEQFNQYRQAGIALGFKAVLSGPLVRSSYQTAKVFEEITYA